MPPTITADELPEAKVLHAQLLQIGDTWTTADVCSIYWRLYVNSRDGAAIRWARGTWPHGAGRIHLVPAWLRFSCVPPPAPIEHAYIHFELVGLPGAVSRAVFDAPLTLPPDPTLERLAGRLRDALREPGGGRAEALCLARAVVWGALARATAALPAERARRLLTAATPVDALAPALAWIDAHLADPLPNALLARRCGLAVDHFIRRFRAHAGQTPAKFVRERRVAHAARLLQGSDESIDAIAATCGFSDRFAFSRVFAQVMGLPPAAYRRARRV